ncbi:galactose metabolism- protein [Marasmius sp. AFHP31]|nr:galactose metabolism- protein [Marasmius sp. AFHP31]
MAQRNENVRLMALMAHTDDWDRPAGFGYVEFQNEKDAQRFHDAVNAKRESLSSDGHGRELGAELVRGFNDRKRPMPQSNILHLTQFLSAPTVDEVRPHLKRFGETVTRIIVGRGYTRPYVEVKFTSRETAVQAYSELQRTPIVFKGTKIAVDYGSQGLRRPATNLLYFRGTIRALMPEEELVEMLKPHESMIQGIKFLPPAPSRSYISGHIRCTSKDAATAIKQAYRDKLMLEYSFRTRFLQFKVMDSEIPRKKDLIELLRPYRIKDLKFVQQPEGPFLSGHIRFANANAAADFKLEFDNRFQLKFMSPPSQKQSEDASGSLTIPPQVQERRNSPVSDRLVLLENLSAQTTVEQVEDLAGTYAPVARVTIRTSESLSVNLWTNVLLPRSWPAQLTNGQSAGFANVQFKSAAGAKAFYEAVRDARRGVLFNGQWVTARLIDEYQKPNSDTLHLTGFTTPPNKDDFELLIQRFGEDVVDVTIAKKTSKPFAQILFSSPEAARQAKLVLGRREERSSLGLNGQIDVFYAKKTVKSVHRRSSPERLTREARPRVHPGTWEPDKLYFRTFANRSQLGQLLYPHRRLIQAIKCLPRRDPTKEYMTGIIHCDDVSAAATVLEACRGADWIKLSYPRSNGKPDEVARNHRPEATSRPDTTPGLTQKIKKHVNTATTPSSASGSSEGQGVPLTRDFDSNYITQRLRAKWNKVPLDPKAIHWHGLDTPAQDAGDGNAAVDRDELVWEDLPELDADWDVDELRQISIVERNPEAVNYVAVGLASPTDDERVVNVVPRDDDWESSSPTHRLFDETDRNDSSSASIVSSVFSSADSTSSSAWDSIDEDEKAEEIYYDCPSHPSSPIQSSHSHPYPAAIRYEPGWTSEIPLELIKATAEEEDYLLRTEEQEVEETESDSRHSRIPTPDIPIAPALPRALDRAILNRSTGRRCSQKEAAPSPPISPGSDCGSYSSVERTSTYAAGAASVMTAPTLHEKIEDDKPFLTVPTHAVLGHLATTAIKHGVVAMASTTRYKSKFMTTVYYKPLP